MLVEIAIPTYKREEKLQRCVKSIMANVYPLYKITIIPDHRRARVFSLLNWASEHSDADIFLGISDDTEFMPDVIEKAAYSMIREFPDTDGIISMNWLNLPNVCAGAIAFVGRKFRERFPNKHLYCPDYISLFADDELGRAAKELSKLYICHDTGLYHYHPGHYPDQMDETHKIGRSTQFMDQRTRRRRQEAGLAWGADFVLIGSGEEIRG